MRTDRDPNRSITAREAVREAMDRAMCRFLHDADPGFVWEVAADDDDPETRATTTARTVPTTPRVPNATS